MDGWRAACFSQLHRKTTDNLWRLHLGFSKGGTLFRLSSSLATHFPQPLPFLPRHH